MGLACLSLWELYGSQKTRGEAFDVTLQSLPAKSQFTVEDSIILFSFGKSKPKREFLTWRKSALPVLVC